MRIAQVAPLYDRVTPTASGDTERVLAYLIEELVRRDHQVTLFASGDSESQARLIAPCDRALRWDAANVREPTAYHVMMLERLVRQADDFDIIHFHMDYLHLPVASRLPLLCLTTLHGRLDNPELIPLYQMFTTLPMVSISQAQRELLPGLNWQGTVYHGVPEELYTPRPEAGTYLAYYGRISPDKHLERAIEIATRAGMPLKLGAKRDQVDRDYFDVQLKALLRDLHIEYVGEIDDGEQNEFLGHAAALLLPIDWPDPSGLTVIEALACGTPTIAYRYGALPELIEDGVTGYIVDDIGEAAWAVEQIFTLNRQRCRKVFESRFSADRMAQAYLRIYDQLLTEGRDPIAG